MWTTREDLKWKEIDSREFVYCFLVTVPNIKIRDLKYQKEEVEQAKIVKVNEFFKMINTEKFLPHHKEFLLLEEFFKSSLKNI